MNARVKWSLCDIILMKFNIDVCVLFLIQVEYTHVPVSIFDNVKCKSSPLFRSEILVFSFFFCGDDGRQ